MCFGWKQKKYACRKTLADSRPRIRGRFARNDEVVEIPNIEDDDSELWVNHNSGLNLIMCVNLIVEPTWCWSSGKM